MEWGGLWGWCDEFEKGSGDGGGREKEMAGVGG